MKKLREVNGHKIVCDETDDIAIDNHTWLKTYCLDKKICEGCQCYNATQSGDIWRCEKNEDNVQSGFGVFVGSRRVKRDVVNRRYFHEGMRIPENCDRKFEHTILTQDMDEID